MTYSNQFPILNVHRSRVSDLVGGLLHPGTSRAGHIESGGVTFESRAGRRTIAFVEIAGVEVRPGAVWASVEVVLGSGGREVVSGLSRDDAEGFAESLRSRWFAFLERVVVEREPEIRDVARCLRALTEPERYVSSTRLEVLLEELAEVRERLPPVRPPAMEETTLGRELAWVHTVLDDPESARTLANARFIPAELNRMRVYLDTVESQPLTSAQRRSVVIDEDRNLVVAAAGSGKTSVLVAKVGYLIEKGLRRPDEILLLAYAKDAMEELRQRIEDRLGGDVAAQVRVSTFHALGLSIIGAAEGRRPSVSKVAGDDVALRNLLRDFVEALLDDPPYAKALLSWFQGMFAPHRSQFEFETLGEYVDYIRANEIRSLQGEQVKSFEECEIANFLYLNGVRYEYERKYEHDTVTPERSQYRPDFYLLDHAIYIEHFAVDLEGHTPSFIPEAAYLEGMKWKRDLHARCETRLVATYSYEASTGRLCQLLAERLTDLGVTFEPRSARDALAALREHGRIDRFTSLLANFLHHFKSSGSDFERLEERARAAGDRGRGLSFLSVFRGIYQRYQAWLAAEEDIDFDDMIWRAEGHVRSGRYESPFGYVLVDEFQDISVSRARLLKVLVDQKRTNQLFAVGDDWQSIFRFAGSDVSIMRDFAETFAPAVRTDLPETFRCCDRIADLASRFVLRNPAQLRKQVKAVRSSQDVAVHLGFQGGRGDGLLVDVLDRVAGGDEPQTVQLLGRYNSNRPAALRALRDRYRSRNLDLTFRTVHGAKGTQADVVVILGVCSGRFGFPSEIADDPLLQLVLAKEESFPHAEERRLFYVALTRARHEVYVLSEGDKLSAFVRELQDDGYEVRKFGNEADPAAACPRCVHGRQVLRRGTHGPFFGCSNYPYCEHTENACGDCSVGRVDTTGPLSTCASCGAQFQPCPSCKRGRLVRRTGRFGPFLGCSRYPRCEHTAQVSSRH